MSPRWGWGARTQSTRTQSIRAAGGVLSTMLSGAATTVCPEPSWEVACWTARRARARSGSWGLLQKGRGALLDRLPARLRQGGVGVDAERQSVDPAGRERSA